MRRLLLALSLLGNAALAAVLIAPHVHRASLHAASVGSKKAVVSTDELTSKRVADALAAGLRRNDPATVRDQLRALGLPDDVIRGVLHALIYRPVLALQEQITKSQQKGANVFWRMPKGMFSYNDLTKEQRQEMRNANRAASKQMEDLLGPDPNDPTAFHTNFLPPDKAEKVRKLEQDYNDLRSQVMGDAQGFRVPGDDEKISYLEKEQRADLEAALTPEELADYDLHNSPTANRLHYQLQGFDATDAEYKSIYAAEKAIDDKFSTGGPVSRDQLQARNEAQAQANAELRTEMGDERYTAYLRSQDPDYRQLESAAKRFDLPSTAVDQVFTTRDQTVSSAQIIANNASLTDEQRTQQLSELANQTRTQIMATLGDDAGDAYLRQNMSWLRALGNGRPIVTDANGVVHTAPRPQPGNQGNIFPALTH